MGQKVLQIQILRGIQPVIQMGTLLISRKDLALLSRPEVVTAKDTLIVKVLQRELPKEYLNPIPKNISISVLRSGSNIVTKSYFHGWTMAEAKGSICLLSM